MPVCRAGVRVVREPATRLRGSRDGRRPRKPPRWRPPLLTSRVSGLDTRLGGPIFAHAWLAKWIRRPWPVDVGAVLNAIFYVLRTGCQRKALPKDLPSARIILHPDSDAL